MIDPFPVVPSGAAQAASRPTPLPVERPAFPGLARFGLVVMAFGLLLDLVEHDLVSHAGEQTLAGFPLSEHLAHLVVLVGMVLVVTGIVRTGVRIGRARSHSSWRSHDAIR